MTDKPIIIDGVDVSGCSYAILPKSQCPQKAMLYAKEVSCIACKENNTKLNFCKNNHNCNYKQLQREKAEHQADHDREQSEINRLCGELQRKTAECERLSRDYFKQNEWLQQRAKECEQLQHKLQLATEALGLILNGYGNDELDLENDYNPIRIADEALEQLGSEE